MLFVDKEQVKVSKFPNGELLVDTTLLRKVKDSTEQLAYNNMLVYKYDGSDSIQELMLACDYLGAAKYTLMITYMPYERMDRVQEDNCYSLQTFMKQLQAVFKGEEIYVLELHSHATEEPISQKVDVVHSSLFMTTHLSDNIDVICYPDKGAFNRFSNSGIKKPQVYCNKIRDFATGKIQGLELVTDGYDIKDKHILIIDDLCSAGGTFYYTAQKLREAGAKEVDLVVTHMENNVLNGKILQTTDGKTVIDHIYCMNTMGNMDELDILSKGKNITVYDVLDYVECDTLVPIIVDGDEIAKYKKHAL